MISVIAAVAQNGVIGKNNLMPWHIPAEMKLFRTLTEGKPVIVGRRTFESLPNFLENRFLIVLSRNPDFTTGSDQVRVAHSIEEALEIAQNITTWIPGQARNDTRDEIMVAGGELVYQQFLPIADRLYISHIRSEYQGDAFFPSVSRQDWQPVMRKGYDEFAFVTYERTPVPVEKE